MSVKGLIFMCSQFINGRLDAKHEQLVAQVQPELEVVLARSVIEQRVQERHSGRLETDIVPIGPNTPIKIVNDRLLKRIREKLNVS